MPNPVTKKVAFPEKDVVFNILHAPFDGFDDEEDQLKNLLERLPDAPAVQIEVEDDPKNLIVRSKSINPVLVEEYTKVDYIYAYRVQEAKNAIEKEKIDVECMQLAIKILGDQLFGDSFQRSDKTIRLEKINEAFPMSDLPDLPLEYDFSPEAEVPSNFFGGDDLKAPLLSSSFPERDPTTVSERGMFSRNSQQNTRVTSIDEEPGYPMLALGCKRKRGI